MTIASTLMVLPVPRQAVPSGCRDQGKRIVTGGDRAVACAVLAKYAVTGSVGAELERHRPPARPKQIPTIHPRVENRAPS
jgi:hypothetical protein